MRIGIDLDNTIICYDGVFHAAALERGFIPADLPRDKSSVRNYLRETGRESDWTELQGYIYGARMDLARPYEGVIAAIRSLQARGHAVYIISHKTRTPYIGPQYDLHEAARAFLEAQGMFREEGAGLPREHAFLEVTLQEKLARIAACGCEMFVDDLPELFAEPDFPSTALPMLFDPMRQYATEVAYRRFFQWHELGDLIGSGEACL